QPEPPKYFAQMKRINKEGPPVLGGLPRPGRMSPDEVFDRLERGGVVVDTRPWRKWSAAHVPGTLNIPLDRSFTTWAGWLLPYGRDLHLIVDRARLEEAVRALATIGLDRIAGYVEPDIVERWRADGRETATVPEIGTAEVARGLERGEVAVVDVRSAAEWEAGHLPGVPNLPVGALAARLAEVPTDRPVVLHCMGGARSAIAASVLLAGGIRDVSNMSGGFRAWSAGGRPVERDRAAPVAAPRPG
ncbi:MAG: rhodanese-like domain-containing protein, partial [Gemmatimonadota bacterium]